MMSCSDNYKDLTSSGSDSADVDEAKILQDVLARKKKQTAQKAQPWKGTYAPRQEDIPKSGSAHDKPWTQINGDREWLWGDEEYDTNGGQS
jgi:hypothetical protein